MKILLLLILFLTGCTAAPVTRWTTEDVMAGKLCLSWPKGVKATDIITVPSRTREGVVISVAPLPLAK